MRAGFLRMDERFEAVDKRFEDLIHYMDKRFEAVDKRFSTMQWLIGLGFSLLAIMMTLYRFLD